MPFNGAGLFVPVAFPDYPAVSGDLIKASMFNANVADLHAGLSNCLTRNGQSPALANLPMAGYRHTGVGAAASDTDYARWDQVLQRNAPGGVFVVGDFSNATLANRIGFKTSEVNGSTYLSTNPNGTGTVSGFRAYNTADSTNSVYAELVTGVTEVTLGSGKSGTGTYLPLAFSVGGSSRFGIGTAGQLSIGGSYGGAGEVLMSTGAGGPPQWAAASGGSVSSFALTAANGFSGSVTTPLTTPTLTLSTTASGVLKGSAGALVAATANTDFLAPGTLISRAVTMNTSRILGRTTAAAGAVEEISIGTNLSLSGGVLACTVSGGVSSVGGFTGAVTSANVATAATAGYGYTPVSPATLASYIPKDLGAGNFPVGCIILGVNPAAYPTVNPGSTSSTIQVVRFGNSLGAVPGGSTWRNIDSTAALTVEGEGGYTQAAYFQRIS